MTRIRVTHLFQILLGLYLRGILCVEICGEKRTVFGAAGADVILPVNQTEIRDITWVAVKELYHFATTKPGGYVDIRYNQYKGRLYGTANGSLNVTKLTIRDQGDYKANINTRKKQCGQLYDLRVFKKLSDGDIEILVNMTGNGTCGGILLCATNRTDVTTAWSSSDGNEKNVTNGFLHFASIVTNTIYNCTAQNPVSAIFKTVNLSEYCEKEEESLPLPRDALNYDIYIYIPIPVILCVVSFALIITCRLNRRKRAIKEEDKSEVCYFFTFLTMTQCLLLLFLVLLLVQK
ncbi:SLAM family member 5-like [Pelobates fuscus]|uniref:SLAM family member 5-like n=1 Tax=Pelobates fuscus TaxID=191477 RepID=UPI002FE4870A